MSYCLKHKHPCIGFNKALKMATDNLFTIQINAISAELEDYKNGIMKRVMEVKCWEGQLRKSKKQGPVVDINSEKFFKITKAL